MVRTDPLGGSSLTRAVLDGGPARQWLDSPPASRAEWRRRADETAARFASRDWLGELRPALAPSGQAARRLERVAAAGGVVVTTGQQPGLFGGPIYTWSKALSALALADALEEVAGIAAAPVFWAATDDSDFAEAKSTVIAVPGGVEVLELTAAPEDEDRMMAAHPLAGVVPLLARLSRGAGAAVYPEALEQARRAYDERATVGGAFVALLRAVLEPLGVAVLDAAHDAVRGAANPFLRDALRAGDGIARSLAQREDEIRARGLSPQVAPVPGLSLVFRIERGSRRRVRLTEAEGMAQRRDAVLSPNVLLRPLVEQEILPTVAYLGGPAELGYFAQVSAVARELSRPSPLAVPRWSGTILEPHVMRILDRYGLPPEALHDPHAAESAIARSSLPSSVRDRLAVIERAIDDLSGGLRGDPEALALLPAPVVEGHRRELHRRLERLERRYVASVKRRQADVAHELATARGALYPRGVRQERALNLLPLLARHGPELLARMRARAGEHAIVLAAGAAVSTDSPAEAKR